MYRCIWIIYTGKKIVQWYPQIHVKYTKFTAPHNRGKCTGENENFEGIEIFETENFERIEIYKAGSALVAMETNAAENQSPA